MKKSAASGLRGEAPEDIRGEASLSFWWGGSKVHGGSGSSFHVVLLPRTCEAISLLIVCLVVDYAGRASFVHFYRGQDNKTTKQQQQQMRGQAPENMRGSSVHVERCSNDMQGDIYVLILVFVVAFARRVPFVHLRAGQEKGADQNYIVGPGSKRQARLQCAWVTRLRRTAELLAYSMFGLLLIRGEAPLCISVQVKRKRQSSNMLRG